MTAHHRNAETKARMRATHLALRRRQREAGGRPTRWEQLLELRNAGNTQKAIARLFGISHQRVSQILKRIAQHQAENA